MAIVAHRLSSPVTETVVSKNLIPRLQPSEQGSHVSPNKSSKVNMTHKHYSVRQGLYLVYK